MAQLNFDASRVEPATGMDAIPAGWYNVMVDQSEMKPTRYGDTWYLTASIRVAKCSTGSTCSTATHRQWRSLTSN
jgi:hypothetical protein